MMCSFVVREEVDPFAELSPKVGAGWTPSPPSGNWPAVKRMIVAPQMHRYADISQAKKEREKREHSIREGMLATEAAQNFALSKFLENDLETLEHKILNAAKSGQYKIQIMKFPSSYCTDGGRAINNSHKNWPETLQGKARSFYLIWRDHGAPRGYHLKARVLDFPNGFLGDIGLYLDWN